MSTWLKTEMDIGTDSLRAIIAAWLNASQRSRDGLGINRSEVQSALNSPKDWIPRFIRFYTLFQRRHAKTFYSIRLGTNRHNCWWNITHAWHGWRPRNTLDGCVTRVSTSAPRPTNRSSHLSLRPASHLPPPTNLWQPPASCHYPHISARPASSLYYTCSWRYATATCELS